MFRLRMMKEFLGPGPRRRGFGSRQGHVFEKGNPEYMLLNPLKDKPAYGCAFESAVGAAPTRIRFAYSSLRVKSLSTHRCCRQPLHSSR